MKLITAIIVIIALIVPKMNDSRKEKAAEKETNAMHNDEYKLTL